MSGAPYIIGAPYVIEALGFGFLLSYEDTPCGRGKADFTDDIYKAMTFPTVLAAAEFWRQKSVAVPKRPDGKPNRPLTAFTIEICEGPGEPPAPTVH